MWLVCCGGSSKFRGGECGCYLVGRVGVGLVDFFFFVMVAAAAAVVVCVVVIIVYCNGYIILL